MQSEIEVKFLRIDHAAMRAKLQALGAVCEQPNRLMHRVLLDFPDGRLLQKRGRLRVRDEGNKVTLTYKEPQAGSQYLAEAETIVASFDDTVRIMETIGLKIYSYQESKRETWHLHGAEVVLDEWPWVSTYIEVEGRTEASIKNVVEQLGLDWSAAAYGSVDTVYQAEYPRMTETDTVGSIERICFDQPLPEWLKART